jgi:hypothetical protein
MKSIKDIIKEAVLKEHNTLIKIDDSHLFSVLIEPNNTKKLFHFLILLVTLILCIVFVISSFIFFISDVLLYKNSSKISYAGAIMPERSCNRQSAFFLFNSADRWAETGIQLHKGDEIRISVSGGFNNVVSNLKEAALNNEKPKYDWVSFSKPAKDTIGRQDYLYNKPDAYLGSILYQIAGEAGVDENNTDNIKQLEINKPITVQDNGILYLSVNGIYVSEERMNKYYGIKNNRDAFYNNNIGEVLVVIDIEQNLNFSSWESSWYRYTEAIMNEAWDSNNIFIRIFGTLWYFLWSVLVLIWKITLYYYPVTVLLLLFTYIEFICKFINKLKRLK